MCLFICLDSEASKLLLCVFFFAIHKTAGRIRSEVTGVDDRNDGNIRLATKFFTSPLSFL